MTFIRSKRQHKFYIVMDCPFSCLSLLNKKAIMTAQLCFVQSHEMTDDSEIV